MLCDDSASPALLHQLTSQPFTQGTGIIIHSFHVAELRHKREK